MKTYLATALSTGILLAAGVAYAANGRIVNEEQSAICTTPTLRHPWCGLLELLSDY